MTAAARLAVALLAALTVAVAAGAGVARAASAPDITAPSAIVVDATSGETAYARAADERRPIASATKLMTALVVLEGAKLTDRVAAVRYRALAAESRAGFQAGERLTIADLLRALLVASANDAAETLAVRVGGSRASFVRLMNRRAQELGLANTHFANPIGLDDPENYSSARDLATLTRALRRYSFFREVVDAPSVALRSGARERTLANRNTLVRRFRWIDGVKTGYTEAAGYVLVASGERRGVPLISVALGTASEDARDTDSLKLLDFGARKYTRVTAVNRNQVLARVPIRYRAGAELKLVATRSVRRVVRKGEHFRYVLRDVPAEIEGPVEYGEKIGRVELRLRGRRVTTVTLIAGTRVPVAGVARRVQDFATRPWLLAGLGLLVVAVAVLGRRRPPGTRERTRTREEVTAA